jgi:hypothetical protein
MNTLSKLTVTGLSLISIFTINIQPVFANHNRYYYSVPPTPPPLPEFKDFQYINTTVNGTSFYTITPFYYKETTDKNIYVSGVIFMRDSQDMENAQFTYIQVDCGRLKYRNIVPWVNLNLYDSSTYVNKYGDNKWQYFVRSSAFENVGKYLCEESAKDIGLSWTWY